MTPEAVSYLVTHRSVLTTLNTYNQVDPEYLREQLIQSGAWKE